MSENKFNPGPVVLLEDHSKDTEKEYDYPAGDKSSKTEDFEKATSEQEFSEHRVEHYGNLIEKRTDVEADTDDDEADTDKEFPDQDEEKNEHAKVDKKNIPIEERGLV